MTGYFISTDDPHKDHEMVLLLLTQTASLDFTDKKYRKYIKEMLSCSDKGLYTLDDYLYVFTVCVRMDNFLGFDIAKLKKRIKAGIKRSAESNSYSPEFDEALLLMPREQSVFKEDLHEIFQFCMHINSEIGKRGNKARVEFLLDLFDRDFEGFMEAISDPDEGDRHTAIWKSIGARNVAARVNKLHNQRINELSRYFASRYRQGTNSIIASEKTFVADLLRLIDKPSLSTKRKTLRKATLLNLCQTLRSALDNS